VIRGNAGYPGPVFNIARSHRDDFRYQLFDSPVFCRDHGNNGYAERLLESLHVDVDSLVFRDIDHIDGDDGGGAEKEQLRKEIKASFEGGRVYEKDDDIWHNADDKIPGDPFLFREGGQAVSAGKIDDLHFDVFRYVGAFLFFDGFPGPVAHVLGQSGEHVEYRRFPDVGLAGEGDDEFSARLGLFRFIRQFRQCVNEDLRSFTAPQHHPCVGHLDNDQPAAFTQNLDLCVQSDSHPGKTAREGLTPLNGVDDPHFRLFQ